MTTPADSRGAHAVLDALHRWFQLYERPITPTTLARQAELLAEGFALTGTLGDVTGRDAYLAACRTLPQGALRGHQVRAAQVTSKGGGALRLTADVLCHHRAESETTSTRLRCQGRLRQGSGGRARFDALDIAAAEGDAPEPAPPETDFDAIYCENRCASFIRRWLLQVEALDGDVAPFNELLAPDGFLLDFSSAGEPITSRDQLARWLQQVPSLLSHSAHEVELLQTTGTAEPRLEVGFRWRGARLDGARLSGRTHHTWQLVDTGERYLRLRAAHVRVVEPLSVIEDAGP